MRRQIIALVDSVGEATAVDMDCCREVVETQPEGQQVTSQKA
jgi:hypothetical protein